MYRGPGDLDAIVQGGLVDPQSVEALPAEGGDEGGVNVNDRLPEQADKIRCEDAQEARQDHQINLVLREGGEDLLLKPRLLTDDGGAGDPRLFRPGDGPDARLIRDNQSQNPAFQLPAGLGVDKGL